MAMPLMTWNLQKWRVNFFVFGLCALFFSFLLAYYSSSWFDVSVAASLMTRTFSDAASSKGTLSYRTKSDTTSAIMVMDDASVKPMVHPPGPHWQQVMLHRISKIKLERDEIQFTGNTARTDVIYFSNLTSVYDVIRPCSQCTEALTNALWGRWERHNISKEEYARVFDKYAEVRPLSICIHELVAPAV
jgi:hypothetical protein